MRRLAILLIPVVAGCATQADIQRVGREQRQIRTRLADTRASLEALEHEVARTRGRIDESRWRRRGNRDPIALRLDGLETRLAALERGESVAALSALADSGGFPPGPRSTPVPEGIEDAPGGLARELAREVPKQYRAGLLAVGEKAHDRAIQAFREFLRLYPDSPLAPNAHYWIGDAYYKLGDYQQAVLNYNRVRQKYPRSERVPAAVLRIGVAFLEMGNKTDARLFFEKVVKDYPSTPEAEEARQQLRSLGA